MSESKTETITFRLDAVLKDELAAIAETQARPMGEVTRLLDAIGRGEPQRSRELLPLVYEELRKLAAARLARLPHFLRQNERGPSTGIAAAPTRGPVRDQEAHLGEFPAEFPGKRALRLRGGPVGQYFPVLRQMSDKKGPHGGAECLLLCVPSEMHQVLYWLNDAMLARLIPEKEWRPRSSYPRLGFQ